MENPNTKRLEALQAARQARKSNPGEKTPSRKAAIRDYCKGCIYDDCSPGTWLQQVTACTSTDCALYPVRPKSKAVAP